MARRRRPDLTVEQARHLLEVIKGGRLEAFYVLALTTGRRRGELLGLRWRTSTSTLGNFRFAPARRRRAAVR